MATVWAYRVGAFTDDRTGGWSHTVNFRSLADLRAKLDGLGLRGIVHRLAIVAHGDRPGDVLMDGAGLPATGAAAFGVLGPYLTPHAMLVFVACIAGAQDAGSAFLQSLSRYLAGRVIVAFSTWGQIDTSFGSASAPGNVQAAPGGVIRAGSPRLSPWGAYAKWACRGAIVRLPAEEQRLNPGNRCANPGCPGHRNADFHCDYRDWVTDRALRAYHP